MKKLIGLLVLTVALAGCSWTKSRVNVEGLYLKADRVEVGATTDELIKTIGRSPNAIVPGKSGSIYLYNFGETRTHGFSLFVVSFKKSNVGLDSAMFFVGEDGKVEEKVVSDNSRDLEWEFWPFGD